MKVVDIIIPVYNALEYTDMCLRSVLKCAVNNDRIRAHITVMDDCSDEHVARYLDKQAKLHENFRVIHNERNLGFVKTCNQAIRETKGDILVLLNSDTVVSQGFVEKIIACFESDSKIGIASPVSSASPNMYINMLPGFNIFSMAGLVSHLSEKRYPDIVTPEGFCYCIRRDVIERQGLFDEVFGKGYGEESDYSMRALKNGFRTVCIDDLYVYHKRHATFSKSARDQRYKKNREIFDERWGDFYDEQYSRVMRPNPIDYLRKKIVCYKILKGDYYENQRLVSLSYRLWTIEYSFFENGLVCTLGLFCKVLLNSIKMVLTVPRRSFCEYAKNYSKRGFMKTTKKVLADLNQGSCRVLGEKIKRFFRCSPACIFRKTESLKVVFILPDIAMGGGVVSVINLVNELLLAGVDVSVVVTAANKGRADCKCLFEPIYFRRMPDMIKHLPRADVYAATLWTTAFYVERLARKHDSASVYFIQDHEVNFVRSQRFRRKVRESYQVIQNKFAKTQWLVERMHEEGCSCHKINPGMDLNIFYPTEKHIDGPVKVLAMNRNGNSRRGSQTLLESLEIVKRQCPDIHIQLFRDDAPDAGFAFEFLGRLSHKKLAKYYRQSDIYIDASLVHGFGRPGVEALACGCALVSTDSGGVREYAADGQNCLLAKVDDAEDVAQKIIRLIQDRLFREVLQQNGLQTIQKYAEHIPAKQFLEWINPLVEQAKTNGVSR